MKRRRRRRPAALASGGAVSDINITPMVDVLLCLLIFTMVIQPGLLKGVDVQVPPPEAATAATGVPDQIILRVDRGPTYTINHEPVTAGVLEARIEAVFRDRRRKVLFVEGAEDATYEDVVAAVDMARGAGIRVIGLVPRESADRTEGGDGR
jgi:biopolymer transport protein ExbD